MGATGSERRQHDRTQVDLPVTLERVGGRPLTGEASTVDLSAGGARLVGPAAFAVGDVVHLTITGKDMSLEHQGLIVERRPTTGKRATLHVAFRTLGESETLDLRRLLERV